MPEVNDKKYIMPSEIKNSYSATFTSYSGCDIIATIRVSDDTPPLVLGELQTITYSTHREVAPVRTLGRSNPVGFTAGQRTIAGSLIFTVFDKNIVHEVVSILRDSNKYNKYVPINNTSQSFLMDEMPPFDITIIMQNEYGHASAMMIKGIVIVDEGQVMSIEDMLTENTMSYMATDIEPLNVIDSKTITTSNTTSSSVPVTTPDIGGTTAPTLKDLQLNERYSDYITVGDITVSNSTEVISSTEVYVIVKQTANGQDYYAKVFINTPVNLGPGYYIGISKLVGHEKVRIDGRIIDVPVINYTS